MIPDDINDLKQEVLLGQLTSIWSKLEPEVQECLVVLAAQSLFKRLPPDLHTGEDGENPMWGN